MEKEVRQVHIGYNDVPRGTSPFCIVEGWPPYNYRSPFHTRQDAEQRARDIAEYEGYEVEVVHHEAQIVHPK